MRRTTVLGAGPYTCLNPRPVLALITIEHIPSLRHFCPLDVFLGMTWSSWLNGSALHPKVKCKPSFIMAGRNCLDPNLLSANTESAQQSNITFNPTTLWSIDLKSWMKSLEAGCLSKVSEAEHPSHTPTSLLVQD